MFVKFGLCNVVFVDDDDGKGHFFRFLLRACFKHSSVLTTATTRLRFCECVSCNFEEDIGVGAIVPRDVKCNDSSVVQLLVTTMKMDENKNEA